MRGKRLLKVLSIDWDYFIDTTSGMRAMLFPDGGNENLPEQIKQYIWGSLYGSNGKTISKINTLPITDEVHDEIVCSMLKHTPEMVMVCDSHKHIYDEIKKLMDTGKYQGIDLVNVDFHHDCFLGCKEVNCGNWLSHVIDEYEGSYTWVSRHDSYVEDCPPSKLKRLKKMPSFKNKKYDLIYICRSDMWSPPHLDKKFIEFVDYAKSLPRLKYEEKVFEEREIDEIRKIVEDLKRKVS